MRLLLLIFLYLIVKSSYAANIYVSADIGNDNWSGMYDKVYLDKGPVKTLKKAKELVYLKRKKNPNLNEPVYLQIKPGVYQFSEVLYFDDRDSGTLKSPTIYKKNGKGVVEFNGGRVLERNNVDCYKCNNNVISYAVPKELRKKGLQLVSEPDQPNSNGLFFNDMRMPIARWPDNNYAVIYSVPSKNNSISFFISPSDFERISQIESSEIWAKGYWAWNWQDYDQKIESMDTDGRITFTAPIKNYGIKSNARFFLYNSIDFLTKPGEWYWDKKSDVIYFWKPKINIGSEPMVPVVDNMIVMKDVSNIEFRDITFSGARGDIFSAQNITNIIIKNCIFKNSNARGIYITKGTDVVILDGEVKNTGSSGIYISGGERLGLVPSNNKVFNMKIHNFAQLHYAFQYGIRTSGVGFLIANNTISEAPSGAITTRGNNNIVENNIIFRVLKDVDDMGAIYMARNWTEVGNIIRNNYFYDIKSFIDVTDKKNYLYAIYLDDEFSGTHVLNNVFWSVERGVFIHGGSDNKVTGNVFINSFRGVRLKQTKGEEYEASFNVDSLKRQRYAEIVKESDSPLVKNYPEILNIAQRGYIHPVGNIIDKNYFINTIPYQIELEVSYLKKQKILDPLIFKNEKIRKMNAPKDMVSLCEIIKSIDENICMPIN